MLQFEYVGRPDVETYKIPFKDAKREEVRQKRLLAEAQKLADERDARDARREKAMSEAAAAAEGTAVAKKRKRTHNSYQKKKFEDWEELQREEKVRFNSKARLPPPPY